MEPEIDLVADLNSEDDDGLGWSKLSDARDAAQVRPGVKRRSRATTSARQWSGLRP